VVNRRFVWLVSALTVAMLGLLLPLFPCSYGEERCREAYTQWMNAAGTPWATPEQAAAVRAWAARHGCSLCRNTSRISRLTLWIDAFQKEIVR
jgi:hypothetical protein